MGDYLLAKSLIIATEIGHLTLMNIIATVAKRMSKGELLQIQKSRKLNIVEAEYFQLISDKTASLLAACCELGALTTSAGTEQQQILFNYGENLGIAFQIKDDLLDYQSKQAIIGKPVGHDLKDRKITLPLLYAFENASDREKRKVVRMMKNGVKKKEIKFIINFIEERNGISRAAERANYFRDQAIENLHKLPPTPARDALENLADFVVSRSR